jgi:hypothetical protein
MKVIEATEGCDAYERFFLAFDLNLGIIGKVLPSSGVLILIGENDTQSPPLPFQNCLES